MPCYSGVLLSLCKGYGIGDYTAWYLTEYGFYIAATYRNVERIREGDGWNE